MYFMKNTTVQLAASLYEVNLMYNTSTVWFTKASRKHANPLGTCESQHWKMGDTCSLLPVRLLLAICVDEFWLDRIFGLMYLYSYL